MDQRKDWIELSAAPAGLCALVLACGGDPAGLADQLEIHADGWLERGSVVVFVASEGGRTLEESRVIWTFEPPDAIQVVENGGVQLLSEGPLAIEAKVDERSASLRVEVGSPSRVLFDLRNEGNRDIYSVDLYGQDLTRLTNHEGDDADPTVAGGWLVFTTFRDGQAELYRKPVTQVGLPKGDAERLTETPEAEAHAALAPDGARLAFSRYTEGIPKLWTVDFGAERWVAASRPASTFGQSGSVEASPSWAPSGDRIAFMSTTGGTADLFEVSIGTGDITRLTEEAAGAVEPAWSPDGGRLAFASDRTGDSEIYVLDLESGEVIQLTDRPGIDGQPSWLPDGRLVFVSWTQQGTELKWLDPERPARVRVIPLGPGDPRNPTAIF